MTLRQAQSQPIDRPMKSNEIALIEWLLASARTTQKSVLTDWSRYRVVGGCGCGSLDVSVSGIDLSEATHGVIAEAWGTSPEGANLIVGLHAALLGETFIVTELEIMPVDGQKHYSLPVPENLSP